MRDEKLGSINVKSFGASGDGTTDDTEVIQRAFDTAERGDRIVIPAGEYVISRRLSLATQDIVFQGYGTLIPHEAMTDYLIEFRKGPRGSVDFVRDTIGLRFVLECLRINGMGRSRGVFFCDIVHCRISNVGIMRTNGCAVKLHCVRECDFHQTIVNHCFSYGEEPLLDIAYRFGREPDPYGGGWQWLNGKTVDGQNNVRFYGLSLVHSTASVYLDIGGDTADSPYIAAWPARAIHFTGCQLHLSEPNWFRKGHDDPEASGLRTLDWDVDEIEIPEPQTMVRIRNAFSVSFSQCNFPTSNRDHDVCVQLGDEAGPALDCSFFACRLPHIPIRADNAKRITVVGCALGVQPWVPDQRQEPDPARLVTGRDAEHVRLL
jgi:hypothetical protein